ncbi:hypothetical protein KA005_21530 [bacterium]|nr:hypothetical protein [bacterium]
MKRFFALFAIMMLFIIPAIAEDQDEINLSSNLTFTFEPMVAKSLNIIPLPTLILNSVQEKTDNNITTPIIVLLLVITFAASVTATAN